jgi:aminoglycoside phosphotransferase (APT) family kinase protein
MDADGAALDLGAIDVDAVRDAAVEAIADAGGHVRSMRRREVHHRPGDEVIVGFDARVDWLGGHERAELVFVAAPLDGREARPQVWCYPSDPVLVGLADAVMPAEVGGFLGLATDAVQLTVRALRPCRRAVIQVRAGDVDLHLKVVAPSDVARVVARHRAFGAGGLPVAPVVALDEGRGWVVMATLPGITLDQRLDQPGSPLPGAADLVEIVERIAAVELVDADLVPASAELVGRHALVIAAAAPALGRRAAAIASAVERAELHLRARRATVHGDLHAGQLLVDEQGRIAGVLDLDDTGHGDVLDEYGRLLAHLIASAVLHDPSGDHPLTGSRRWQFVLDLADAWADHEGGDGLSPRVAASLLGWATAPWRAQDAGWSERVEALLAATEDVLALGAVGALRSRRSL